MNARANLRTSVSSPPALAGIYVALGASWVLATDLLIIVVRGEPVTVAAGISMVKGAGFVVLTGGLLYLVLRHSQSSQARAHAERTRAVERLAKDRSALIHREMMAQEEERRRLSVELHDGPAQYLAAAHMLLEAASRGRSPAETTQEHVRRAYDMVGRAQDELRTLVRGLRPPELSDLGLVGALRAHCEWIGGQIPAEVSFAASPNPVDVPHPLDVALYRIVQEALSNAAWHARASRIRVQVEQRERVLLIEVSDDGCGFTPSEAPGPSAGHLGLTGMKERADMIGASLKLQSSPKAGTRVRVLLPLSAQQEAGDGDPSTLQSFAMGRIPA